MPQQRAESGGLPKGRDISSCGNGKDATHGEGGISRLCGSSGRKEDRKGERSKWSEEGHSYR